MRRFEIIDEKLYFFVLGQEIGFNEMVIPFLREGEEITPAPSRLPPQAGSRPGGRDT
jgi:hypothetical protein